MSQSGDIMSLSQAEELLAIIKEAWARTQARAVKLAGNEWVIYLPSRRLYIWNKQDWYEKFAPKEKEVEEEARAS